MASPSRGNVNPTSIKATPPDPPKVHPGERLANFFDNFFKTIIGISTFGASMCFSKVVQTPVQPWIDYGYSKVSVQFFLSNAFLFFVLDLMVTSFAASALQLWRETAIEFFGTDDSHDRRTVMWWATFVTCILLTLLMVAFFMLGLIMVAYAGPVGWITIAFTGLFGLIGAGVIIWQSPIGSPPPPRIHPKHHPRQQPPPWAMDSDYLEKLDRYAHAPAHSGDDYEYLDARVEDDGYKTRVRVEEQFFDDGDALSRRGTLARPPSVAIPEYTSDLRRYREFKRSGEYDSFIGKESGY
jgi:hypothetical protein